ncbi:F-box/LRR-repeat protein 7 [Aphanomyces cochlioides]|nr:F-box/LRR-repeat protein 7 [Aphanomyces cochlioides]
MGGQGHKELIPFAEELLAYMREKRAKEQYFRVFHMMHWIKRNQKPWLDQYVATKKDHITAFAERHKFNQGTPCVSKVNHIVLEEVWLGYAAHFWSKYHMYPKSQILNADETGVYFDMPPGKTLAEVGKSSKVDKSEKHSDRITVVLTIRTDGISIPESMCLNLK